MHPVLVSARTIVNDSSVRSPPTSFAYEYYMCRLLATANLPQHTDRQDIRSTPRGSVTRKAAMPAT